jgi:hypothetical protein
MKNKKMNKVITFIIRNNRRVKKVIDKKKLVFLSEKVNKD